MRFNMINKRKELGYTQEEIAKEIGRNRNTYASYELGTITPSLEIGLKIKKALKTNDDNIFLNHDVTNDDHTK